MEQKENQEEDQYDNDSKTDDEEDDEYECNKISSQFLFKLMMMEQKENEEQDQYDNDSKTDDEQDDEYECNRISSQFLFKLMIKSRDAMSLKITSNNIANNRDNITYLNMYSLYKYFTNSNIKQNVDIKHGYIVKKIVNSIYDTVTKDYEQYKFLRTDNTLNQKLHEYIAKCCELICNIMHHQWDICPLKLNGNKSLIKFDDRIHIKDNGLSMEDSTTKIAYCCFAGIITKSCWNQFNSQWSKDKMNEKQINKFIKYRMWTCLNDEL